MFLPELLVCHLFQVLEMTQTRDKMGPSKPAYHPCETAQGNDQIRGQQFEVNLYL